MGNLIFIENVLQGSLYPKGVIHPLTPTNLKNVRI